MALAFATPAARTHVRGLSKAVMVYEDLRAAIVGLTLEPGARIDKNEVCAKLRVSRQPVTEALLRLVEERLVEVEPQKGTFVARIRLSDIAEAAFVRRALEVATVYNIAPQIDEATLERLDRNLGYQAAALNVQDWDEFYTLDVRFHAMLFERLAMRRIAEAVESTRAQVERTRRLMLPAPGRTPDTYREHRAIVAALKTRDSHKAATAMARHLDAVMMELKKFAARHPNLFEP